MLFYSRSCKTCINLLNILKNENFLGYFKLVCVDDILEKLPPDMIVPMMTLSNINQPLVAQETFGWISKMKFFRDQQLMNINKKIIQQNQHNNTGPIGFDDEIMGGISDKFAFTKKDVPLPHAYQLVDGSNQNAIFTAPEIKDKVDRQTQSHLLKEIATRRDQQDVEFANHAKQQQINAAIQSEQKKLFN